MIIGYDVWHIGDIYDLSGRAIRPDAGAHIQIDVECDDGTRGRFVGKATEQGVMPPLLWTAHPDTARTEGES